MLCLSRRRSPSHSPSLFTQSSHRVKPPLEQILGRVEDVKTSPQGSASPGTPSSAIDRGAAKRAELRRMEQERRRREAVSMRMMVIAEAEFMYFVFVFRFRRGNVKSIWTCKVILWLLLKSHWRRKLRNNADNSWRSLDTEEESDIRPNTFVCVFHSLCLSLSLPRSLFFPASLFLSLSLVFFSRKKRSM